MNQPTVEHWLPVVGYEGIYEVSDQGRVRSLDRIMTRQDGRPRTYVGRVLRQHPNHNGYLMVTLYSGEHRQGFSVHRLVVAAHLGPIPEGLEVCHIDGTRTNNAASNLRVDDHFGNMADRVTHGTEYKLYLTHCPWGHPYSGDNLVVTVGWRRCRHCERAKAWWRARQRSGYYEARGLPIPTLAEAIAAYRPTRVRSTV